MKYTYVEFADGTLVTFNDIRKDKDDDILMFILNVL